MSLGRRLLFAAAVLLLHGLALQLLWGGTLWSASARSEPLAVRLIASSQSAPSAQSLGRPARLPPSAPPVVVEMPELPEVSAAALPALPIEAGGAAAEAAPLVPPPLAIVAAATPSPALSSSLAVEPPRPARRADCAPAPHPPLLRERGIEGLVRLRVWVDELGRAGDVLVAASSGFRLFDEAAVAQARRCPYEAAREGGREVASWVEFPVRFALLRSGANSHGE